MSRATISALVKLVIFTIVSVIVTGTLVAIMGKLGGGDTEEYAAIFTNASLVEKGDDVRVAGVVLGKVEAVEIHDKDAAKVTFSVAKDLPLTSESTVEIRYLNLVGDRYVTVEQGDQGGERLRPGATIPMENTTPALNLTALYNGFAPLFSALTPKDINELSLNLVKVLQGEGGTIESLMSHTASLTSAIADRDKLVGQVIGNLNELLGTVDSRHEQLTQLIIELRRWVGGLADDRIQIGRSVVNLSSFTKVLAELITEGRPILKSDIFQLGRLAKVLSRSDTKAVLNRILTNLPEMLEDQTRTGTYGSWYNYYVCGYSGNITLPREIAKAFPQLASELKALKDKDFRSTRERCNL